jgi:hypothetical protein
VVYVYVNNVANTNTITNTKVMGTFDTLFCVVANGHREENT